jgi:Flp pilus assembly protein TadG
MLLKKSRRGQRGSLLVLTTIAVPVFLVPLVGLGIDATICYIVQAELSAAVDGAALGTGRLLSTNANANDIANEFLNANFRVGRGGFWSAYNLTPTINVQTGTTKIVTISATADVPLLFMRILGKDHTTVAATAQATRRDARIELVIDRSGSMNRPDGGTPNQPVIDDVVQYAQGFTQQFTEGYDEMGLVAFSESAVVGYPTTPWPASLSPTDAGGPDTSFQSGASTDMVHQIANIQANGGTAMGDALHIAYVEIQKAHMRDLAANGKDTRSNAIVLFTDGVPSSLVTYLNRKTNSVIAAGSNCTYPVDAATPTNPIYGAIEMPGNPIYSSAGGLYQISSLDTTSGDDSVWQMKTPLGGQNINPPTMPAPAGCKSTGWSSLANLSAIPVLDKYGYPLNTLGYHVSAIVNGSDSSVYNGTEFDKTQTTSGYHWGLAVWNEVDNVAQAIRTDANYANRTGDSDGPIPITIYTIGYTGNGGTDYGLLEKVANVQGCKVNSISCYNNTEPAGLYIQASDKTSLANAFSAIATAILRLAR